MSHTYKYPRAALTVDSVVFGRDRDLRKVVLIKRKSEPFAGRWALPGGFLELDETLEEAACRELAEETGVRLSTMKQLHVFDALGRDPRERTLSVVHVAVVQVAEHPVTGGDDASEARWFDLRQLPELAFDHAQVLQLARATLGDF